MRSFGPGLRLPSAERCGMKANTRWSERSAACSSENESFFSFATIFHTDPAKTALGGRPFRLVGHRTGRPPPSETLLRSRFALKFQSGTPRSPDLPGFWPATRVVLRGKSQKPWGRAFRHRGSTPPRQHRLQDPRPAPPVPTGNPSQARGGANGNREKAVRRRSMSGRTTHVGGRFTADHGIAEE